MSATDVSKHVFEDLYITGQLDRRPSTIPDYRQEMLAVHELAGRMADKQDDVLISVRRQNGSRRTHQKLLFPGHRKEHRRRNYQEHYRQSFGPSPLSYRHYHMYLRIIATQLI